MRTVALSACPVCGSEQAAPVDLGAGEHRRCLGCRATYSAAYADPDEVFSDGYFSAGSEFGVDVSHPRFQAYLAEVAGRRCAILEGVSGAPGTLLDVGCGTGEFPAVAAQRGWRVQGLELIAEAADHARRVHGLDVREGLLADSGLPEGHYDAVSALHVLEHVPDAVGFLRELAQRARPGGHVLIEVPNLDSVARASRGARWAHLRPLEHLTHFTPATLRGALERAGLEPVVVRSPTWIWKQQTHDEALLDLGRTHRHRLRRLPWPLLHALAAADDRRGRGAVVLAVARVP